MTANAKVKPTLFLQYRTYICARHCKALQVRSNRESTDRQYKLTERTLHLGWSKSQIKMIDGDMARSDSGISEHPGFALMTPEIALGYVSLILSIEVSRVASNNTDGYRLLVLGSVAYTNILIGIGDEDSLYPLGFLNDRRFGPSTLVSALVLLPRSLLSHAVKFFLRYSWGYSILHRPGLDQSNLCRYYYHTFILQHESRSLIPAAWTSLNSNLEAQQTLPPDKRPSTSAAPGSCHLLPPRKIVDSLLRKIDSQEQATLIPSKKERERATSTRPLARSGKTAPGTDPLGGAQPQHPTNDHRPTLPIDQPGGLSKNSGGQP